MDFDSLRKTPRRWARLVAIARISAQHGLAAWLGKIPHSEIHALLTGEPAHDGPGPSTVERIPTMLTTLGTTFVKLGQVLSTRPDLVGDELADALSSLQSGTPPDSPEVVHETIVAELGDTPENLFSEFAAEAFASASIGQVHRAKLKDGTDVVVKVQHKGIEAAAKTDLDLLEVLASQFQQHVSDARPYQPVAVVREFKRVLLKELDFSNERRNLERFRANFKRDDTVVIPEPYPELCSRRVLTMQYIDGHRPGDRDALVEAGANLDVFARRAASMYLNMIMRDGFYHADPHPGNYVWLEDDVVGVLDFGMVGRIENELREEFEGMLIALQQQDSAALVDLLLRMGSAPPSMERRPFERDIGAFLADYATVSLAELKVDEAIREILRIVREHHLVLPSELSLLLKTLMMLDGTSRQLDPQFSLAETLVPYQRRLMRERLKPMYWLRRILRGSRAWERLITRAPRDLMDILDGARAGTFEVHHEHSGLQHAVDRLVTGILAAALFIGSSWLWSAEAPPTWRGVSLPGAIGFAVATLLGFGLLRRIRRAR